MRQKISNFFYNFMQGRNGMDELARTESYVLLAVMIIDVILTFTSSPVTFLFTLIWLIMMIHLYFRVFSRNIAKRSAENQKYLNATESIRRSSQKRKVHRAQKDVWRYFKCPQCHQEVRVPAKRGKICITCPKCRTEFVKKT